MSSKYSPAIELKLSWVLVSQNFFWDLRSSPANKLWNMRNSASSTLRSLLSPIALSQNFFGTTCRLSRALQASTGKSGHGSVEGDWEEYWREICVWSGAEGMNTTPQQSVVMTLLSIDISRIVRCDDFSRAILTALVQQWAWNEHWILEGHCSLSKSFNLGSSSWSIIETLEITWPLKRFFYTILVLVEVLGKMKSWANTGMWIF